METTLPPPECIKPGKSTPEEGEWLLPNASKLAKALWRKGCGPRLNVKFPKP